MIINNTMRNSLGADNRMYPWRNDATTRNKALIAIDALALCWLESELRYVPKDAHATPIVAPIVAKNNANIQ